MISRRCAFVATPAVGLHTSKVLSSSSFTRDAKSRLPRNPRQRAASIRMNASKTQDVNVITTPPSQKPPPAAFAAAAALGEMKASQPAWKVLLLGIVAGAYIAMGALLALTVGGAVPGLKEGNVGLAKLVLGAFGLPFGLTMVVTAGGELFTGNTLLVTAAMLQGKTGLFGLVKNWVVSFAGNFVGSLLIVKLALVTGVLSGGSVATAVGIALSKCGLGFWKAVWRGVACNWLVCLGVYMSTGAADLVSKFVGVWLPISAFVAMGFDHSVANMFLIPMGKALGASVGWKEFLLGNLLPVTLGNVIGGAGLVALVYWLAYGRK